MKIEECELGKLVHLNSGSPALTITDIDEDEGMVTVEWVSEDGRPQQAIFPVECVREVVL